MKQFFKYAVPALILISIITACEKEYESIESIDDKNVAAYIQTNKLTMVEYQDSGIFYQILSPGSGADIEYSEEVPLVFSIRSIDGKFAALDTFGSGNRDYRHLGYVSPEALRVGVKEILKKKSGAIRLVIPSRLAFGRNGAGNIPGNASLDITVRALDKAKIAAYDDFTIQKYLATNSLTGFSKTKSGIYYKIADPGTGSPITIDSTIVAEYTGKFLNGVVFDKTTVGSGVTFDLNGDSGIDPQPIAGWQEAAQLVKQGGSIRFVLPSSLAYGLAESRGIPPFSCLDFELKITDVKKE